MMWFVALNGALLFSRSKWSNQFLTWRNVTSQTLQLVLASYISNGSLQKKFKLQKLIIMPHFVYSTSNNKTFNTLSICAFILIHTYISLESFWNQFQLFSVSISLSSFVFCCNSLGFLFSTFSCVYQYYLYNIIIIQ